MPHFGLVQNPAPVYVFAPGHIGYAPLRILLVDDHALFTEGLKLLLADLVDDPEFQLAESCEEALALSADRPDIILLDFHLPGVGGQEACYTMRAHFPGAIIVVVSGEDDPATIRKVISDGAAGFIPKSSSPEVMMAALKLILAGGSYLPPHVLDEAHPPEGDNSTGDDVMDAVNALSDRQMTVLAKVIQGKLNKVIASELNIAEGTVKAHLSAAFKALGARNRTEAVYIATRLGLKFPDTTD